MPPRARATTEVRKASSVADFKKAAEFDPILDLPSGKAVEVRQIMGFKPLLKAGVIPNSLMTIVQKSIDKGEEPDLAEFGEDMDMDKIDEMMEMIDSIAVFMIVNPVVHAVPKKKSDRDPTLLYVDELDEGDKVFIMQWVTGGTRDLEQFRKENGPMLAALSRSEDVVSTPVKSSGTRRK